MFFVKRSLVPGMYHGKLFLEKEFEIMSVPSSLFLAFLEHFSLQKLIFLSASGKFCTYN